MEGEKRKNKLKKESKRIDLHVKVKKVDKKEDESQQEKNIEQAQKEVNYVLPTQVEKDRIALMWGGAIFFMAVILICWVAIFKDTFGGLTSLSEKADLNFEPVNKIMEEFNSSFSSTTKQITSALANEAQLASTTGVMAELPANTDVVSGTMDIDQNDLNRIKEEIIKLENKND